MLYTSVLNQKIKDIKKLNTKKYRDITGMFLVEGEHLVLEAYKAGYLQELILEEGVSLSLDVLTNYVTRDIINYISELESPQSIIGICKKISQNENIGNHVLVLDGIQDPGNLGTIIRSAVAFNVDTIILGDNTVDIYNSKVIRASQGMIFNTNFKIEKLSNFLESLKLEGYKILGTKVITGKNLKTLEKSEKFAIIMGNEGNGISSEVEKICDDFIYIKMNPVCESLNVGVATSIILYELDK